MENKEKDVIDMREVVKSLWAKRKVFYKVIPAVFILSCVYILPEPRYYTCEVALAPESEDMSKVGGLSSIASSLGFNIGSMTNSDAIYPLLYPDLFESPEFVVSLFSIPVKSADGEIDTDYYTYLKTYQKVSFLKKPFMDLKRYIGGLFAEKETVGTGNGKDVGVNPFYMSRKDYSIVESVKEKVVCGIDKKTDVVTIKIQDQDKLICATLADSVRQRLQNFIIDYRTKKAREDLKYYRNLTDSAKVAYDKALNEYAAYSDSHREVSLQSYSNELDKLRNEVDVRLSAYNAFNTQLSATIAKIQERTPSFTVLKSATVPIKPAGPKRMIFVFFMTFMSFFVTSIYLIRDQLFIRK